MSISDDALHGQPHVLDGNAVPCPVCGGPTEAFKVIPAKFEQMEGGKRLVPQRESAYWRIECVWRRTAVQAGGTPCPVPLVMQPTMAAVTEEFRLLESECKQRQEAARAGRPSD